MGWGSRGLWVEGRGLWVEGVMKVTPCVCIKPPRRTMWGGMHNCRDFNLSLVKGVDGSYTTGRHHLVRGQTLMNGYCHNRVRDQREQQFSITRTKFCPGDYSTLDQTCPSFNTFITIDALYYDLHQTWMLYSSAMITKSQLNFRIEKSTCLPVGPVDILIQLPVQKNVLRCMVFSLFDDH